MYGLRCGILSARTCARSDHSTQFNAGNDDQPANQQYQIVNSRDSDDLAQSRKRTAFGVLDEVECCYGHYDVDSRWYGTCPRGQIFPERETIELITVK